MRFRLIILTVSRQVNINRTRPTVTIQRLHTVLRQWFCLVSRYSITVQDPYILASMGKSSFISAAFCSWLFSKTSDSYQGFVHPVGFVVHIWSRRATPGRYNPTNPSNREKGTRWCTMTLFSHPGHCISIIGCSSKRKVRKKRLTTNTIVDYFTLPCWPGNWRNRKSQSLGRLLICLIWMVEVSCRSVERFWTLRVRGCIIHTLTTTLKAATARWKY